MEIALDCCLANELFEETGTFKPPMPEELGIEGNDHNRIKPHRGDFTDLAPAFRNKMTGLRLGHFFCGGWIV